MTTKRSELRLKNTLDCLKDMYETSKKNGHFECMRDYMKTYTVSMYLGLALLQEKIVKKIENGRSYQWIASNAPNEGMVERVFERICIIGRTYTKNSNVKIPDIDTSSTEENTLSSTYKGNVTVNVDDWFDAYKMLSGGKYSEKDRRELSKEFARWKVGLKKFV